MHRQVTAAIAVGTAVETLLRLIAGAAARLCASDFAAITLLTGDGDSLELAGVFGTRAVEPGLRVPVSGSLNGLVIKSGRSVRSSDALRDPRPVVREIPRRSGARGILMVPLRNPHGPFGTLAVAKRVPWRFTDRDAALLTQLADSASIAIQNAQLRARIRGDRRKRGARAAVTDGPPTHAEGRAPGRALDHLPPREREILDLLVAGG
ncbi:MAG TPA: GAF domain-containing protein, partial [Candidatus Acidoferrales bacterium]|nr:GAF domain-containing protein [Candidatus Acidoferrales bacterium]